MINLYRFAFNVFFACCGGLIGERINRFAQFCMCFAGAVVGDLLWQIVMEVIA